MTQVAEKRTSFSGFSPAYGRPVGVTEEGKIRIDIDAESLVNMTIGVDSFDLRSTALPHVSPWGKFFVSDTRISDADQQRYLDSFARSSDPTAQPTAVPVPLEIIEQFHGIQDEARTEGYPVPSDELVECTRKLLRRIYQIAPRPYTIYPGERGEIVIDARRNPVGAFVLLCHEKETWGIATIRNKPFRTWFREWGRPSEGFIKATLAALPVGGAP